MAIVFVSSKRKQRIALWSIIGVFALVIAMVSLVVFPPDYRSMPEITQDGAMAKASIAINFNVVDSDQVKNMEPFSMVKREFSYEGRDKNRRLVKGKLLAVNKNEAELMLSRLSITPLILEETLAGNSEPFASY
jgi:hypothetical protein